MAGMIEAGKPFTPGLVSVVVLSYNQESLIEETIRSALNQTYPDIEVIVSDDASSDGTVGVVQAIAALDGRVRCVVAKRNGGITENCNRGLMAARGEFVAWLGGDDIFLPEKIDRQVALFRRDPCVTLVGTDVEVFFADGSPSYVARCKAMNRQASAREFIRLPNHIPSSSFMFRRGAVPGLRFDPRLKVVSDWLFNVECALAGRIDYVAQPLTRYRRWSNNVTAAGKEKTYLDDRLISTDILLASHPELAPDLAVARSNALFNAAKRFVLDRDYGAAAVLAKAAISEYRWSLKSRALLFACWLRFDMAWAKVLMGRIRRRRRS